MSGPRIVVPVLLAAAAIGAIVVSADGSALGRLGGIIAAVTLGVVAAGSVRGRNWALGAAFFLGLFWLWATLALRLQGVMTGLEVVVWLSWSVVVMIGSVRARQS